MKQRTKEILELLKEEYPDAKCELNYKTPFQLLVATILSAQTTDKKVNEVTKTLFNDYPDVESFSKITQEELENRNDEKTNEALKQIDVLVDGRFVQEKKDPTLKFRGSSNQRILDVQKCISENKIVQIAL